MPTPTDRFGLDTYDPGESWDHTDTVQFLDESAIEVDTITNRPTSGSYDGELFFATDQRILYQWDAGGSSWDVELGLGVDGTPVPGTSHFEALEADTLIGADVANASENQILVLQGDGTLKAETQAQGPNPYDQAQTFDESNLNVTNNNTEIANGSIQLFGDKVIIDDFESNDLAVEADNWNDWDGDIVDFSAQSDTTITGTYSGELLASNPNIVTTSRTSETTTSRVACRVLIDDTTKTSGDSCRVRLRDGSSARFLTLKFDDDDQKIEIGNVGDVRDWASNTVYFIEFVNIDFADETYDLVINGTTEDTAVPFEQSVSGFGEFVFENNTGFSSDNRSLIIDDVQVRTAVVETSGDAIIEWDRGIPTDIFEWDVATFTKTLDNETVNVFVAYSSDDGSTWQRTNSGNPISRNYSLNEDTNITTDVDVRIETELSRADTANNPSLDSAYRSWLV